MATETVGAFTVGGANVGEAAAAGLADTGSTSIATTAERPDSVSRFSRCKSVRMSAAFW
jgi:hypothetical protein